VKLAAKFVNGTVLNPGEVFSYNKVVGERTAERGFKNAQIFASGEIVDGLGGGICQVSSTLYMATLYADLEVVERRNHMFIVDYTKLGEDATVAYGSVDYKFRNDTNFPIRIDCWVDSPYVYVEIYGTREETRTVTIESVITGQTGYETVEEEDPSLAPGAKKVDTYGHTGYTVDTYRVVKDANGNVIRRDFEATSRYAKLDKKVLVGPTASPSVSPSVSPSPSAEPTQEPTAEPTVAPTEAPTQAPTQVPTQTPTQAPTEAPTPVPTQEPTPPPVQTLPPTEPPAVG